MKLLLTLFFSLLISASHAEELFVPLSQFDNDSQRLTNNKVLEFWGYHNYNGSDNYQNILKLRYYNPIEAGDWRGRIRLDTSYASNYNSISSADNAGQYSAGNTMVVDMSSISPIATKAFAQKINALGGGSPGLSPLTEPLTYAQRRDEYRARNATAIPVNPSRAS